MTFKTQQFSHEVARPVDLREAKRFRMWVVEWVMLAVVVPGAGMVLVVTGLAWEMMSSYPSLFPFIFKLPGGLPMLYLFVIALTTAFLYTVTGIHTYWFHPRHLDVEQQNRAVALSYYACAPLAFLPPFLWLVAMGFWTLAIANGTRSAVLNNIGNCSRHHA